jgi:hypothetical protein
MLRHRSPWALALRLFRNGPRISVRTPGNCPQAGCGNGLGFVLEAQILLSV